MEEYRVWIDDERPCPLGGWRWMTTTNQAIDFIKENWDNILGISFDHDAGARANDGGDYIEVLKWLEEYSYIYDLEVPFIFHIHSDNAVGRENMLAIIKHNNWKVDSSL